MKKTAVIYWSGTGNTEAMANAVLEGMTAAGADAKLLTVDQVNTAELNGYAAIAFGCPAMGSEVLEEMSSSPCLTPARTAWAARPWLCSAPTAGATASGCAPGKRTAPMPA